MYEKGGIIQYKIILMFMALSVAHVHADFRVYNDTDEIWYGGGHLISGNELSLVQLTSYIMPGTSQVAKMRDVSFADNRRMYFYFFTEYKKGCEEKALYFDIPTRKYFEFLKGAKQYLPIFRIMYDKDKQPQIIGPKTEKELDEAIETAKEYPKKMPAAVREALPREIPDPLSKIVVKYVEEAE